LARMSTPRSMRSRASCENLTSLAAMFDHSDDERPFSRLSWSGLPRPSIYPPAQARVEGWILGTSPRMTATRRPIRPRRARRLFPRSRRGCRSPS
jgi:hypothetical protein